MTRSRSRRPIRSVSMIWCDFHGCIHERDHDPYDTGTEDCTTHWRSVYIYGSPEEAGSF